MDRTETVAVTLAIICQPSMSLNIQLNIIQYVTDRLSRDFAKFTKILNFFSTKKNGFKKISHLSNKFRRRKM